MKWPNALIKELSSRRCIIFLGAGASASCISAVTPTKRPPTWSNFLGGLINIMSDNKDLDLIKKYLKKDKYLEAAEIIKEKIPQADFNLFIKDELAVPNYKYSKIHESILNIDPKIVVTTNYDEIYDNFCRATSAGAYSISKYYDGHIVSDLKSPTRLIIKAHGCVTNPSKMILTKSEYFSAHQQYLSFYKILNALFITHTILFIGYSLNDPDIQLVLENVNITAQGTLPHYFVTESGINKTIKESYKKTYNIEFIEFKAKDYAELETGVDDLNNQVNSYRSLYPAT